MDGLSLRSIVYFKVGQSFPPGETRTMAELAQLTNQPEATIRRLLRHAMRNHIFREPAKNVVAHTPASVAICHDPKIRAWVGLWLDQLWGPFQKTPEALDRWPSSEETTQTGVNVYHNSEQPFYQIISQ